MFPDPTKGPVETVETAISIGAASTDSVPPEVSGTAAVGVITPLQDVEEIILDLKELFADLGTVLASDKVGKLVGDKGEEGEEGSGGSGVAGGGSGGSLAATDGGLPPETRPGTHQAPCIEVCVRESLTFTSKIFADPDFLKTTNI